jgi:hypothetical protein
MKLTYYAAAAVAAAGMLVAFQQQRDGFTDTPILPGQKWHVHDPARPYPAKVVPGPTPGAPPSDAIVLFDGKDLSKWQNGAGPAKWKAGNGYFEVDDKAGDLTTRDKFGDCQLHVEWQVPPGIQGQSQERGNSGVYLMSRYEIQVLESHDNTTYADGQAGAMYGQWPPLVNPARPQGQWNVYDILFEAPKFDGGKLVKPGYQTVFFNGVAVHNHKEVIGATIYRQVAKYTPHGPEEPLLLQAHHNPVRYRNIWIRRMTGYDQPEK